MRRSAARLGFNLSVRYAAGLCMMVSLWAASAGWALRLFELFPVLLITYYTLPRVRLWRRPRDLLTLGPEGVASPCYFDGEIAWTHVRGAYLKPMTGGHALCLCVSPEALANVTPRRPAVALGDRLEIPFCNLMDGLYDAEPIGDFAEPKDIAEAMTYINLVASVSAPTPFAAAYNAARVAQLSRRAFQDNPGAAQPLSAAMMAYLALFVFVGSSGVALDVFLFSPV